MTPTDSRWRFTDAVGSFEWRNPRTQNQLYFPICNEAGLMASVNPLLHGDCTTGQHTFVRLPLVIEDLHNTRSARNFWIYSDDFGAYSLTGNSALQRARLFSDEDTVETRIQGTFLSYTVIRTDREVGIETNITIFSPITDDKVEIMWVTVTNRSKKPMTIVPTASLPIYGRSADNLRDHNHWTSMSHRMKLDEYGICIKPVMHHDERGHRSNNTTYFVLAVGGDGQKPIGQFPTVSEFIGEGGSFDWPAAVVKNLEPYEVPPNRRDGLEAVGAIRFSTTTLRPGASIDYIVIEGATEDEQSILRCIKRYGTSKNVKRTLEENMSYWQERVQRICFETGDKHFGTWMHWVALQPVLRKIYGNSFLPHFDYGKGGRGWRDLWQDCLALLLQDPDEVRETLVSNFAGVRLDGSNATIIGKELGTFAADRNKISRVWMDHGTWPFFTLKLYVDQTGDLEVLFQQQTYWKDHQIRRAKGTDNNWTLSEGTVQKTRQGEVYSGTMLEHVLVQHLTCFHNVGEHNHMKLEDADWNDLLDMANERGESVPFSAFYGWNLLTIAEVLSMCKKHKSVEAIELFPQLLILTNLRDAIDYGSPEQKHERLNRYFDTIEAGLVPTRVEVPINRLIEDLRSKGEWILEHVGKAEWIESKTGHGFFNGYYNNDGMRVDGDREDGAHMNLTAQTFTIMSGAATDEQVRRCFEAATAILKDPNTGGYRLTTPLGPNTWNFGRGFAVVYGEKETGATFNHMVVMFLNGLYRRGFVKEAFEVFTSIYNLANDTPKAKIYPGIPEYINQEGTGKYHYLTGSASWLLMTVLTEMFGIKGDYGDLLLHPKLVNEQFDENGEAKAKAFFAGRRVEVVYRNRSKLDYPEYRIADIRLNGHAIDHQRLCEKAVKVKRSIFSHAFNRRINTIEVELGHLGESRGNATLTKRD